MTEEKLNKAAEIHAELSDIEKWVRQAPEESTLNILALINKYEPGHTKTHHHKLMNILLDKLEKRKKVLIKEMEKL